MIENIYQDKRLKYPLTDEERSQVEKVWDFARVFIQPYIFISDYRENVIREIRAKYTPEQFYQYENILNKMFWNLRWLLFPLWLDPNMSEDKYYKYIETYGDHKKIPYSLLLCNFESYEDNDDLKSKLKKNPIFESTYYRSFINKLVMIDQKNKLIVTKPIEGSSDIFAKNYFNLMTMTILFNKDMYEEYMKNVPRYFLLK